jgi:orotidine 5'-phosphate decarboxylase subfamily 1
MMWVNWMTLSYTDRAAYCVNPTAKKLCQLIASKQTNLSVSCDFTEKSALLHYADLLGPEICVLKTHIDILEDFDHEVTAELTRLAQKHQFLIFEDRKFADIGNTVKLQYAKGIYHIAEWAHLTNSHTVTGGGSIEGLKQVGLPRGNGLLLLAQMSAKGNLMNAAYTQASIDLANAHPDFVIGFIAMHRLTPNPALLHFTPGVHISAAGDTLGQQYVSPETAILEQDTDIIIVGRGIYEAADPQEAAKEYRHAAWQAYQEKCRP